jgi:hypothetical protein
VVVQRVAGGVDEFEHPAAERHRHAVGRGLHPLGIDADQLAIRAVHLGLAVDHECASVESARVDHVAGTAWVHQHARPGQGLHQGAGAAGMVQVHMGRDDPVDSVDA